MPISTPYRQPRQGSFRCRQAGGVAVAIIVVALAAALTLPAAVTSTAGSERPFAQRIFQPGGGSADGGHFARFQPGQSIYRVPV